MSANQAWHEKLLFRSNLEIQNIYFYSIKREREDFANYGKTYSNGEKKIPTGYSEKKYMHRKGKRHFNDFWLFVDQIIIE